MTVELAIVGDFDRRPMVTPPIKLTTPRLGVAIGQENTIRQNRLNHSCRARPRIMKKYGEPHSVVTDGLCSYSAAMNEIGVADRHEVGGRLNNRAENSHQPFRRRERAMQRFRSMKRLQKFSSVPRL